VLLDQAQSRAKNSLEALGLRTLAIEMHDLDDLRHGLETVGAALGRKARGDELVRALNGTLQEVADRAATRTAHPVVLILIDRDPAELRDLVAAGPGSYLDELLVLTGARNLMSGAPVRYPKLALEHILRTRPDIIIDVSQSGDERAGLERWKELAELPVYKQGRIHRITDRRLLSPSTEVGVALDKLMSITAMDPAL
jgi:iron complex transport system substrate-binding protein